MKRVSQFQRGLQNDRMTVILKISSAHRPESKVIPEHLGPLRQMYSKIIEYNETPKITLLDWNIYCRV
jgi:hypothetical protein